MSVSKFNVGDSVFSPHFGEGIIIGIDASRTDVYPILVEWTKLVNPCHQSLDCFTLEGKYTISPIQDPEFDIYPLSNLVGKKEEGDDEKMKVEDEKFHVGDKVFSFYFGFGVVDNIIDDKGNPYPVAVRWSDDSKCPDTLRYFSEDGVYDVQDEDPEMNIHPLRTSIKRIEKFKEENMPAHLEPIPLFDKEDAVNPSHYKVNGLPEAYEIMRYLMHKDQYEGFLWGNIIKYSYRYGRKGDKAETAGKIAWYATQLKELEEETK